jgi:hypothetical protein
MSSLAAFIMKGRSQAVLVISAFTILSWMLSLASLLAAAAVALPTLRRGAREGGVLMAAALLVVVVAGMAILGNAWQAGGYALAMWVPVWLMAIILRETASLSSAVMTAMGLGLLIVTGFYLVIPDPADFWQSTLQQTVKPLLEQRGEAVGEPLLAQSLEMFSSYATGAIAAGSVMTVLFSLLLARWWQAGLYNPGGFRGEFLQLRLPMIASALFMVLALIASIGGSVANFATNLLFPVVFGLLIAGFSVVHAICAGSPSGRYWLIGLYLALMFMAPIIVLIALVGVTDPWFNWRLRLAARQG